MKILVILFLILLSSCQKNQGVPDGFEYGEIGYEELILGATSDDHVKSKACVMVLILNYIEFRENLLFTLLEESSEFHQRDISSFVLKSVNKLDDKRYLAKYYSRMLLDPDYHTFDYLKPFAHRHGGKIGALVEKGKYKFIQVSCPMDQIVNLGLVSIPYLFKNLSEPELRSRVLSFNCMNTIVNKKLSFDSVNPDLKHLETQLKQLDINIKIKEH